MLSRAAALPDPDVDRRAWHLASAATGADEAASAALEQAGTQSRDRSAYATAAGAFERAGRLADDSERRARLVWEAAEAAWNAASPAARSHCWTSPAYRPATQPGLCRSIAEAAGACFYAGEPAQMLSVAERASRARLPHDASIHGRFLAAIALGMARIVGGDAAAGAAAIHDAIALAESSADLRDDPQLLPWLAVAPIFLREAGTGRSLLDHALSTARARAALGTLPFVLNLIARDQATTDRYDDGRQRNRRAPLARSRRRLRASRRSARTGAGTDAHDLHVGTRVVTAGSWRGCSSDRTLFPHSFRH